MKNKCMKCGKLLSRTDYYGLHKSCFLEWFALSKTQKFQNLDPKKSGASSDDLQIKKKKDTFYHGRYLKYSASLNGVSYILKVQEKKYSDLPCMEYLCNCIASLLSVEVPKYYLIIFNKKQTFVNYNFMQDYQESTLHHIYKFLPDGEENHNCSKLIRVIKDETNQLIDIIKFIKICLFDSLIGNNDRHGRNLGIIETRSEKRLAPMYDNPSYFGVADNFMLNTDLNPSCSIWTSSSKEPKFLDYIKEFEEMGFKKICIEFKKKFLNQFQNIEQEINKAYISTKRKKAFLKFLLKKVEDCEKY